MFYLLFLEGSKKRPFKKEGKERRNWLGKYLDEEEDEERKAAEDVIQKSLSVK